MKTLLIILGVALACVVTFLINLLLQRKAIKYHRLSTRSSLTSKELEEYMIILFCSLIPFIGLLITIVDFVIYCVERGNWHKVNGTYGKIIQKLYGSKNK